jgi:hypothetical protein
MLEEASPPVEKGEPGTVVRSGAGMLVVAGL